MSEGVTYTGSSGTGRILWRCPSCRRKRTSDTHMMVFDFRVGKVRCRAHKRVAAIVSALKAGVDGSVAVRPDGEDAQGSPHMRPPFAQPSAPQRWGALPDGEDGA